MRQMESCSRVFPLMQTWKDSRVRLQSHIASKVDVASKQDHWVWQYSQGCCSYGPLWAHKRRVDNSRQSTKPSLSSCGSREHTSWVPIALDLTTEEVTSQHKSFEGCYINYFEIERVWIRSGKVVGRSF
jgi:hypothetical protein